MTKEQFAQLVLDSTDTLYRVSKGILRNDSDCEDAVWEAIGVGFEKLHTLREDKYAKTWLVRIVIHECYKVLKKRSRQVNLPDGTMEYVACHEEQMQRDLYANCLEVQMQRDLYEEIMDLEEKYRIPIVLFYLEGYSIREIAEILQSTENTVKSWLSRGRSYLKKKLEEGWK